MGDLNGGIDDNDIAEIMVPTGLYNIIGAHDGSVIQKKHINGLRQINFFLGSLEVIDVVRKVRMLPFDMGIDWDHRGMF